MPPDTAPPGWEPAADLLAGRVILVTGAAAGLGRAIALACGRLGATVVLLDRQVPAMETLYDELDAAGAPQPAIYPLNLAAAGVRDFDDLADTLAQELGRIDGIAHCAAHFSAYTPLADISSKDWLESLQVNLTAAWNLTRACLPHLVAAPLASVVFTTCACGREPAAFQGAYGITKAALEALARTWALELEQTHPNLRIHSYDPGPLQTDLRRRGYPQDHSAPPPESAVPGMLWRLGGPEGR